jgi:hypothetical protein
MVMNLRVPKNVGNFLSSRATGGFSRKAWPLGVSYKTIEYKFYLIQFLDDTLMID